MDLSTHRFTMHIQVWFIDKTNSLVLHMPLVRNYYFYYTAGVGSSINKNMDEVHSDIPTSTQR